MRKLCLKYLFVSLPSPLIMAPITMPPHVSFVRKFSHRGSLHHTNDQRDMLEISIINHIIKRSPSTHRFVRRELNRNNCKANGFTSQCKLTAFLRGWKKALEENENVFHNKEKKKNRYKSIVANIKFQYAQWNETNNTTSTIQLNQGCFSAAASLMKTKKAWHKSL